MPGTGVERAGFCEPCKVLWTWQSATLTTSRAGCPVCGRALLGRNATRGKVHDVAHRMPITFDAPHMGARSRVVSVHPLDVVEPGLRQRWLIIKSCGHREHTPVQHRPRPNSVRACGECPAQLPNNLRRQQSTQETTDAPNT